MITGLKCEYPLSNEIKGCDTNVMNCLFNRLCIILKSRLAECFGLFTLREQD